MHTAGAIWHRMMVNPPHQRGHAVSVLVLVVVPAIVLLAGVVIDGGQQAQATSRAESVAAGAARAAGNGGITSGFVQDSSSDLDVDQARRAARDYLAAAAQTEPRVTGRVTIDHDHVLVHTEASAHTIFLSLIGIDTVTAHGSAEAEVVAVR